MHRLAAEQAAEKLSAKSVEAGKYDLVLDPTNLWLTIHESAGHPTELDRVLGYEANFAGTSFLTLDKWKSKKFNYGSPLVNIVADKTQPGSLGAVGYDDEGVGARNGTSSKTASWSITRPSATRRRSSVWTSRRDAVMRKAGRTSSSSACPMSPCGQAKQPCRLPI